MTIGRQFWGGTLGSAGSFGRQFSGGTLGPACSFGGAYIFLSRMQAVWRQAGVLHLCFNLLGFDLMAV